MNADCKHFLLRIFHQAVSPSYPSMEVENKSKILWSHYAGVVMEVLLLSDITRTILVIITY